MTAGAGESGKSSALRFAADDEAEEPAGDGGEGPGRRLGSSRHKATSSCVRSTLDSSSAPLSMSPTPSEPGVPNWGRPEEAVAVHRLLPAGCRAMLLRNLASAT